MLTLIWTVLFPITSKQSMNLVVSMDAVSAVVVVCSIISSCVMVTPLMDVSSAEGTNHVKDIQKNICWISNKIFKNYYVALFRSSLDLFWVFQSWRKTEALECTPASIWLGNENYAPIQANGVVNKNWRWGVGLFIKHIFSVGLTKIWLKAFLH